MFTHSEVIVSNAPAQPHSEVVCQQGRQSWDHTSFRKQIQALCGSQFPWVYSEQTKPPWTAKVKNWVFAVTRLSGSPNADIYQTRGSQRSFYWEYFPLNYDQRLPSHVFPEGCTDLEFESSASFSRHNFPKAGAAELNQKPFRWFMCLLCLWCCEILQPESLWGTGPCCWERVYSRKHFHFDSLPFSNVFLENFHQL